MEVLATFFMSDLDSSQGGLWPRRDPPSPEQALSCRPSEGLLSSLTASATFFLLFYLKRHM